MGIYAEHRRKHSRQFNKAKNPKIVSDKQLFNGDIIKLDELNL